MERSQFIVTVPPQQLASLRKTGVTAAHLCYQVGAGPRLLRAGGSAGLRGGIMVAELGPYETPGQPGPFCQEVLRECRSRNFSGVLLDFDLRNPYLEKLAASLDEVLYRSRLQLYVPESYAPAAPHAKVMISSALSGGSLTRRLQEVQQRFGRDRIVLALEKSAEDFTLPAPTGCGTPLSEEELAKMLDEMRPRVFFSQPLCARYFTYLARQNSAHFVLFDDGDTLRRKIETARSLGLDTFLLPWTCLRDCLPIDAGAEPGVK